MPELFKQRSNCPVCDSTSWDQVYASAFNQGLVEKRLNREAQYKDNLAQLSGGQGGDYILAQCAQCGALFQLNILREEHLSELYESWTNHEGTLKKRTRDMDFSEYARLASEVMSFIAHFNKKPGQLKVYDYGMGFGQWCQMAKAFNCQTHGSDISPSRCAYAEANGITVLSADELPAGEFDFINCNQVLEHLSDPLEVLQKLTRALKPDGLIHLNVPDCRKPKRELRKGRITPRLIKAMDPLQHINGFDHDSLLRLAARVGLKPVSLPLWISYACNASWLPPRKLFWYLWRPFYTKYIQNGVDLYFQADV